MRRLGNIFLIVIDSLRFDNLGCYGYHRATSPAIDNIASQGVKFEQVISQSSWTKPSITSLLTSTYPEIHGVKGITDKLSSWEIYLPNILKKLGYLTGCIQTNPFLSAESGFKQGFDFYLELFDQGPGIYKPRISEAIKVVFDWLDQFSHQPFFLYLHILDTHNPYSPPEEFRCFGNNERDLFDGEVRFVDFHIGLIQNYLALKGLEEKTILIITSDHGEEFGEHGQKYHAKHLYSEVLKVPLIISCPALLPVGCSLPNQVRLIDIVPTLLDLLGVPPLAKHQGESLLPLLNFMATPERPAISQIGEQNLSREKAELISLTTENYKLIWNKKTDNSELYYLPQDPGEKKNIAEEEKEKVQELKLQLENLLQMDEEKPFRYKSKSDKVKLDTDLIKRLKGLGYME